jgi:hypothetical protein
MGQVSLELSEYQELIARVAAADLRTTVIQAELEREKATPADERLVAYIATWTAAKEIIDYAVGNLSPEFSRNWPHEALKIVAEQVGALSAASRDQERAIIWRDFRSSILEFEAARQVADRVDRLITAEDVRVRPGITVAEHTNGGVVELLKQNSLGILVQPAQTKADKTDKVEQRRIWSPGDIIALIIMIIAIVTIIVFLATRP